MFAKIFVLLLTTSYLLLATPVFAACDAADCPAGLDQIELIFGNVISVVVGLGFVATLVLVVFAGIKYLTSGGEPKAIQSTHHMLTWALLGIFFMAVAWIVLQLIAGFTGVDVTVFDIQKLCTVKVGGIDTDICPH